MNSSFYQIQIYSQGHTSFIIIRNANFLKYRRGSFVIGYFWGAITLPHLFIRGRRVRGQYCITSHVLAGFLH